jgi:hypothetical protein
MQSISCSLNEVGGFSASHAPIAVLRHQFFGQEVQELQIKK